jgi:hypothetical protein
MFAQTTLKQQSPWLETYNVYKRTLKTQLRIIFVHLLLATATVLLLVCTRPLKLEVRKIQLSTQTKKHITNIIFQTTLSFVMQLLGRFNNILFPHDLSCRAGFATATNS